MSFHDSTHFIFEFLLKLAHMSLLKVFMQYLRVRQRTADSPPVLVRIYQRQFQSVGNVKIQRRTVRQDTADSPGLDRMVGSARLDL